MRCLCCNRNLSDYESTLKQVSTGDYADTCLKCLKDLDILVVGNNSNSREQPLEFTDVDEEDLTFDDEDEEEE